jgi:hypothetical protein
VNFLPQLLWGGTIHLEVIKPLTAFSEEDPSIGRWIYLSHIAENDAIKPAV